MYKYAQIYFYSWHYIQFFFFYCFFFLTKTLSDGSSFFPSFLPHTLSLSSRLYLNTNGGLLKRNCPQNAGVPVVFHTLRACRTSRTRVEIIGACASFPRLQVIIGLSGLHVAWCSTERCLWQQEKSQIFKSSIRWFGPEHMSSCELMTWTIYFRCADLFPSS